MGVQNERDLKEGGSEWWLKQNWKTFILDNQILNTRVTKNSIGKMLGENVYPKTSKDHS